MSDPSLGLTMLGLIVLAIMMGFPTAFTLMFSVKRRMAPKA